VSTAQGYIKRFYTKVEIHRTNPHLVLATAVYLACKMEECPQHIRLVVTEARSLWPQELHLDTSKLGECEFFLISEMNSQLIVHQPYRTLTNMEEDFNLCSDEVSLAWSIINDHYMTDLPLLYPPHIIALTAILLALVLSPPNGAAAGGGGGSTSGFNNSDFVLAAAAAFAQVQARTALIGGGAGAGAAGAGGYGGNTPSLTPQSSQTGQSSQQSPGSQQQQQQQQPQQQH
jgi:cyclin C